MFAAALAKKGAGSWSPSVAPIQDDRTLPNWQVSTGLPSFKGESEGHPFRGNQWAKGTAGHFVATGRDEDMGHHRIAGHVDGQWVGHDGKAVHESITRRLDHIKMNKSWTDIRLHKNVDKNVTASGTQPARPARDAVAATATTKEKPATLATEAVEKRVYSAEGRERSKAVIALRGKAVHGDMANIERAMVRGTEKGNATAAAALMLKVSGLRVGSEEQTGVDKTYGVTTLEARHVSVEGDTVHLKFLGKSSHVNDKSVTDATVAHYVRQRLLEIGNNPTAQVFDTTDGKVGKFVRASSTVKDIKTKDIRTWNANDKAREAIAAMPIPRNSQEYKAARTAVGEIVAKHLQNTPSMALDAYIAPEAFQPWSRNKNRAPGKGKAPKAPKAPVVVKADDYRYDPVEIQKAMDAAVDPTMTLSEASHKRMTDFYNSFEYDNVGNWQNLPDDELNK